MLTAAETRRSEAEGELVLAQQVRSPCLCVPVCLCVSGWGLCRCVSQCLSLSPRVYGWQALRLAFEEEAAALQSALQSAEGALSRAEAWAQTGGTEDEERSREEAKQRYVGDVHYKGQSVRLSVCMYVCVCACVCVSKGADHYAEAAQAEGELERLSKAYLLALAGVSSETLRQQLIQLRTVDPAAGAHRSEVCTGLPSHSFPYTNLTSPFLARASGRLCFMRDAETSTHCQPRRAYWVWMMQR